MDTILCCTRGGEASIRTQDAAIQLAKETGSRLIFFMAFDVEFMAHANYALRSDIVTEEMGEMCDFLMTMAVERAEQQGVEASYIVRQGPFHEELKVVIDEVKPDLAVLGRPLDDTDGEKLENLEAMCEKLQEETQVPFRILPEE